MPLPRRDGLAAGTPCGRADQVDKLLEAQPGRVGALHLTTLNSSSVAEARARDSAW